MSYKGDSGCEKGELKGGTYREMERVELGVERYVMV